MPTFVRIARRQALCNWRVSFFGLRIIRLGRDCWRPRARAALFVLATFIKQVHSKQSVFKLIERRTHLCAPQRRVSLQCTRGWLVVVFVPTCANTARFSCYSQLLKPAVNHCFWRGVEISSPAPCVSSFQIFLCEQLTRGRPRCSWDSRSKFKLLTVTQLNGCAVCYIQWREK
jgi:hypothetical protein